MNKINTVKSSNLPKSIKKVHHHFAKMGRLSKFDKGLTIPKPGPTLPNEVAEAPREDIKSNPRNPKTPAPTIKSSIYSTKNAMIL